MTAPGACLVRYGTGQIAWSARMSMNTTAEGSSKVRSFPLCKFTGREACLKKPYFLTNLYHFSVSLIFGFLRSFF